MFDGRGLFEGSLRLVRRSRCMLIGGAYVQPGERTSLPYPSLLMRMLLICSKLTVLCSLRKALTSPKCQWRLLLVGSLSLFEGCLDDIDTAARQRRCIPSLLKTEVADRLPRKGR